MNIRSVFSHQNTSREQVDSYEMEGECSRYRKVLVKVLVIFFSISPGIVHYLVYSDISLLIFYLVPVIMATWFLSTAWGVFIALLGILSWLASDLISTPRYTSLFIPVLNQSLTFIGFLFIVYILSRLRHGMSRERELATHDHLTGIFNRRAFYERAHAEIERTRRFNRPLSVAYLDLDNFKDINDLQGHFTGDRLLCVIAMIIRTHIRSVDVFARIGGDEFVILFPETGGGPVQSVAEKIQAQVEKGMKANGWQVTVSIGVVTFERPPVNVDEILRLSDMVMYKAKHRGKNCIMYETR